MAKSKPRRTERATQENGRRPGAGGLAEHDVLALKAAYLYGHIGLTQTEVARYLDIDAPRVARLTDEAERKGWIRKTPEFLEDNVSPEVMAELQGMGPSAELEGRLDPLIRARARTASKGVVLRQVRVFHSGTDGATAQDWDRRLARFSSQAARYVCKRLSQSAVAAVAWGGTVSSLVDAVEVLPPRERRDPATCFMPLAGERIGEPADEHSASSHASRLARVLNVGGKGALSLAGVPAILPRSIREDRGKYETVRELFSYSRGFREVFLGTKDLEGLPCPPLLEALDTILTSAGVPGQPHGVLGAPGQPLGTFASEFEMTGRISLRSLAGLVVGDIGGVLVAREGLNRDQAAVLEKIQSLWNGVRKKDFDRVASSHAPEKSGIGSGVILVAIGGSKAPVVAAALERINYLVIDHDLARALAATLEKAERSAATSSSTNRT